jgi:hypothetical protein
MVERMNPTNPKPDPAIYTIGGTVQANEQGLYIARDADAELLRLCRESTFAYVLTPRQMGKSSLMIRTAERLIEDGWQAVIIDLTQVGAQISAEDWYRGLLTLIADQLMLTTNIADWWQRHDYLGVTQRLTRFFQQVVLPEVASPIVIFVDEIDTTLSLNFTDDFFAAIRFLYVARATEPEFRRLSFVLIGVATPGDLIRDAKRTPFNVGQRVELTDFTLTEAMPLAAGLGLVGTAAEQTLGWVLHWTGMHYNPYLTQRLCQEMAKVGGSWTEAKVERMVSRTFLGAQSEQNNNLQFVRDMLTKRAPEPVAVLQTYRAVRRGEPAVVDEEQSLVKSHLKLSGVVKRVGKALQVRNRVYYRVFDRAWIREHLPESLWQRLKPAMPIIATLLVAFLLTAGIAVYANQQRIEAVSAQQRAEQQTQVAEQQRQEAERQTQVAERERQEANKQTRIAKRQTQVAEQQRREAKKQTQIANKQTRVAETQAQIANEQRRRAENQTQIAETERQEADRQTLIAKLREQAAQALYLLTTPRAVNGMVLAIQATAESHQKNVPEVFISLDNSLLKAVQMIRERNLLRHEDAVSSVAFSPDGQHIVSGSLDKTLRLWDLQGNAMGQPFQGHESAVRSVAFSPDGQHIVSGSDDKTVRLWLGNWQGWLKAACTQLQEHSVLRKPEESFDPEVAKAARQACEEFAWNKMNYGSR